MGAREFGAVPAIIRYVRDQAPAVAICIAEAGARVLGLRKACVTHARKNDANPMMGSLAAFPSIFLATACASHAGDFPGGYGCGAS